jgi:hypothetical protein
VTRSVTFSALLVAGSLCPAAQAGPWDAPARVGYSAGLHAVVALGPVEDGGRWGFGLDAGIQRFWHEGPYRSDVPDHVGPLLDATARLGWLRHAAYVELIASAGAMYPLMVGDGGFLPAAGLQAGLGLGLSSDGSAGPILSANLLAPYTEARVQVMRWDAGWHKPRLSFGPMLELNCCSYYNRL